MKLEEAQNRQQNIIDKLETLNKALKEASSLGLVIKVDTDNVIQMNPKRSYHYTEIRVFVGIRPSDVEL